MESREEYYEMELEQEVVGFNANNIFDCILFITIFIMCIVGLVMAAYNVRDWYFRRRMEKATKLWQEKDKKINRP